MASRRHYSKMKEITNEQRADLLVIQKARCGVCKSPSPQWKTATWLIDHDHITGEVRGLLCYPCNIVLGYHEKYRTPVAVEFLEYLASPPAKELGLVRVHANKVVKISEYQCVN